mgnify:CR=1 FL=1
MANIEINGIPLQVKDGAMVIEAADAAGITIPRFCYHKKLPIAANCRMCLVEVEKAPKPLPACATPIMEGMVVFTHSENAVKAQKSVMEFLLINHPLDCPICDQGGECDLQDQAMAYGVDFSRSREAKRSVEDLNLGPLVATTMTRCISCTRCVRFTSEIAGITVMGQTGRGEDAEIVTYLNGTLDSNLQGNIIDLCPVGALTSKPYAFSARPWELKKTETIDVMDALGSNIRVDTKGREVMRIVPRNHDGVNEEWISDKTRFIWDGLRRQRLDTPYVRVDGKLAPATWAEAFSAIKTACEGKKIAAIAGDLVSVEAMYALKAMINGNVECRVDGAYLPIGDRGGYVGTATIEDIDNAQMIQLIGTNPRNESPVLNARIRKAWLNGAVIGLVGEKVDLTYEYAYIGDDRSALQMLADKEVHAAKDMNTIVIIGQGALTGKDGEAVLEAAKKMVENTNSKFMVLHTAAARVGGMDIGFTTEGGMVNALDKAEVIYNLGADELDIDAGPFVIYQGSHGDRGAHRADVILPGAAYTEESGIFVNTEGRPQMAERAGFAPGDARENWAILRALSAELGEALPYNSLNELRAAMFKDFPHLAAIDEVPENAWKAAKPKKLGSGVFTNAVTDFYQTNPIARASSVMAEMAQLAASPKPMAAE